MKVVFDIQAWWHAGTGAGNGQFADAVVNRGADGLPYLPGRSVKGLLRSAMELGEACNQVPERTTTRLFGSGLPEITGEPASIDTEQDRLFQEGRFSTHPGELLFSSATMPQSWRQWAQSVGASDPRIRHFFHQISSTAVEDTGIVQDHSLRTIEVTIPLLLEATLVSSNELNQEWKDHIKTILPLVRHLGAYRNRGLGRVELRWEDN